MKRLLHRNSKKGDGTQPASPQRSWAAVPGLAALQSRERSGSQPQIRHLAMEGHAGPVTHATMDEIRREAATSSSNLRINSMTPLPAVDVSASEPVLREQDPGSKHRRDSDQGLGTDPNSDSFPQRTTSAAYAPLRIDTAVPRPPAAGTDDSDASLSMGAAAASAGGSGGFDTPAASRRVISDKIKHLANRFSNSGLRDQAPAPPQVRRRPSNSPSVSERVSLFDAPDPRSSDIFGKFGMASAQSSGHSRSSSAASTPSCDAAQHPPGPASSGPAPPSFAHPASPAPSRPSADHQPTITAGVRLSFSPPSSAANSAAHGPVRRREGSTAYRASLHSVFAVEESLHDAAHVGEEPTTPSSRSSSPKAGNRLLRQPSSIAHTPSSPSTIRSGSFRRPGSVVTPHHAPALAQTDLQRSHSTAARGLDPRPTVRNRSISYSPAAPPAKAGSEHPSTAEETSLISCLSRSMDLPSDCALDSALAMAIASNSASRAQGTRLAPVAAASQLIHTVASTSDTGEILPSAEYSRRLKEAASLESKLQALRMRLSMEISSRDKAKSLIGSHRTGSVNMFKTKGSIQAHTKEYDAAGSTVRQTETDIADASAKLHSVELTLRNHQVAVLLATVRSVVAEAAAAQDQAQADSATLESRITDLQHKADESHATHAAEMDTLVAQQTETRRGLDEQIRSLKNQNHDAAARQATRAAEDSEVDPALAQHSATLAVERLNGELTVLKEQKQEAEQRIRALEGRLDEALLVAQESQNSLDEARQEAAEAAQSTSVYLASVERDADRYRQCVKALDGGLRTMISPLRVLSQAHGASEKLRSLTAGSAEAARTPPVTPTLKTPAPVSKGALSVDTLETLLDGVYGTPVSSDDEAERLDDWDMDRVVSATFLLASTLSDCTCLYSEALLVHDAYSQLQQDLGAEQRLREAQGLAITQQREKLARANYLAESAEQRVKEATDALSTEHAKEQATWCEERQRLLDNTERLADDLKANMAGDAGRPQSTRALSGLTPSAEDLDRELVGGGSVGVIESVGASPDDSHIRAEELAAQVLALQAEISTAKEQLQARSEDNEQLAAQVSLLRRHDASLDGLLPGPESLEHAHAMLTRKLDSTGNMGQMLAAYSEKLMAKEDALRSREEELESVRDSALEIEQALQAALGAPVADLPGGTGSSSSRASRPSLASLSPPSSGSWSFGSPPRASLRDRSASFFQGLRTSYRTSASSSPEIPSSLVSAQTEPMARSQSPPAPVSQARQFAATAATTAASAAAAAAAGEATDRGRVAGIPSLVRRLMPLVQTAAAETRHLRNMVADLESHSQSAHVELLRTRRSLERLREHCSARAIQEDAVQQDIAHVLAQISRLREKVIRLESEKGACEEEADVLRRRCRQMEDRTTEQVLQLIVERTGKRDWERQSAPEKAPERAGAVSAVAVSHPEAGDIRAEFNELMHSVISRRDEDIERVQALADAWRDDARRAARDGELRIWNTGSRGTQTT
ncbi:hypothetical protein GGF46_003115 [Coemansia sp. RSA 552]|nr:hypothetical protein GGF46_003115 [Coemansia sp. RSA 552]